MLKYEDLVSELQQRPLDERLSLLQVLAQSIQKEVKSAAVNLGTPAERLRGIAKPEGPLPSDEALEEMRFNDMLQKYS
ncbi:MAG: hypothetical protein ACOYL3_28965 [Desulfuromonadaceae bacterium]